MKIAIATPSVPAGFDVLCSAFASGRIVSAGEGIHA